ncbi:hypothetical protein BVI1335_1710004 [Burkholderia vietnamiensis]|nr:hypothetical protein BVI1335_1710004 [Burkholderia vietnamiensis]
MEGALRSRARRRLPGRHPDRARDAAQWLHARAGRGDHRATSDARSAPGRCRRRDRQRRDDARRAGRTGRCIAPTLPRIRGCKTLNAALARDGARNWRVARVERGH